MNKDIYIIAGSIAFGALVMWFLSRTSSADVPNVAGQVDTLVGRAENTLATIANSLTNPQTFRPL